MEALVQNLPQLIVVALVLLLVARLLVGLVPTERRPRRLRRRRQSRTIRVVGVGGGGSNAVHQMLQPPTPGVEFIACNTDAQALRDSAAPRRIQIGAAITHGLGAGGDPSIGQRAAEDDARKIAKALRGSDLVFVTAGLGGGTGSGAAPIIAGIAREEGALTVGIVTKPFAFEGAQRRRIADDALEALKVKVDTLIAIPNDRARNVVQDDASMLDAFRVVDDVLRQAVQGIIDVITLPGLINLDFADVRAIMKDGGLAVIGIGRASGENRAVEAARQAISSPLLEVGIDGARSVLFQITGPPGLGLAEVTRAADEIRAAADPEANVIFGASFADGLDDVLVTVLATGVEPTRRAEARPARTASAPARVGARALDQVDRAAQAGSAINGATQAERAKASSASQPASPERSTDRAIDGTVATALPTPDGLPTRGRRPVVDPSDLEIPSFLRRNRARPVRGAPAEVRGASKIALDEPVQAPTDTPRD